MDQDIQNYLRLGYKMEWMHSSVIDNCYQVDVVTHDTICHGVADLPPALARFLGDVSGLAEFVDDKVMFCRHASCWRLDLRNNSWERAASLHVSQAKL